MKRAMQRSELGKSLLTAVRRRMHRDLLARQLEEQETSVGQDKRINLSIETHVENSQVRSRVRQAA